MFMHRNIGKREEEELAFEVVEKSWVGSATEPTHFSILARNVLSPMLQNWSSAEAQTHAIVQFLQVVKSEAFQIERGT